jgi:Uma2 family endonuclease
MSPFSSEGDGILRYRWTVAEFLRLMKLGILSDDTRLELIEGVIFEHSPPSPAHIGAVDLVKLALDGVFQPHGAYSRQEHALDMGAHDLPMPDIAVVPGTPRSYAAQHPTPDQVRLVCEVADTTLLSDRRTKVPLYARAGIPECWILNLPDRRLEVFRDPQEGVYQTTLSIPETGTVTPVAAQGTAIAVADLLP